METKTILYEIEKRGENREVLTFKELNKKGEKIQIEFCFIYPDNTSKNSLPNLWRKHGFTNKLLNNYISISTYATDKKGNCWGKYNPQIKKDTNKIDFDYMLEINKLNKFKLIDEVYKLAFENI